MQGLGIRLEGVGLGRKVQGSGFVGFRLGFWIQGLGFRVYRI